MKKKIINLAKTLKTKIKIFMRKIIIKKYSKIKILKYESMKRVNLKYYY